jgi:hypothetical protein
VPELPLWGEVPAGGGEPVGIAVATAHMMLDRAGLQGRVRAVPLGRIFASDSAPDRDFMLTAVMQDSPPPGLTVLAVFGDLRIVVAARRGIELHSLADLERIGPIARIHGVPWPPVLSSDPAIVTREVRSVENAIRMLAAGRISAVTGTDLIIDSLAQQLGDSDILGDRVELEHLDAVLASNGPPADPEIAAALAKAAREIAAEGSFVTFMNNALRAPPADPAGTAADQ